MARGTGTTLQIGKESVYGTAVPATVKLNYLSESLKYEVNRKEEESLLAGKATAGFDIMSYRVSGDFSVILKPENVGILLKLAMGTEGVPVKKALTTGVYEHVFTPIDAEGTLPSFSAEQDRNVSIKGYSGLKIDSISIDAKAGDYIRSTISIKGKAEATDTMTTLAALTKKSFLFKGGSLSIDSTPFQAITSVKWSYSNGLDDGLQTLGSGDYFTEPEHDLRNITIELEAIYDTASEVIRQEKYVEGALADVSLTFESPEEIETDEKYTITIVMPNVAINEAHPNISGRDRIMLNIKGVATQVGSTEPVTVKYYSEQAGAY